VQPATYRGRLFCKWRRHRWSSLRRGETDLLVQNPDKGNLPLGRAQSHRVQYAGVRRVWIAGLPKDLGGPAFVWRRGR
jgi:hypothetical protein